MKKPKQRPYKGTDKKPITDMSERKRAALKLWANYHASRKFKRSKQLLTEPTIKIKVGGEYDKNRD
jgi:hypothetical protein